VHGPLGLVQPLAGGPQRRPCELEREVVERAVVADHADELAHHAEPAASGDGPVVHR
jgi:hypothetical protein